MKPHTTLFLFTTFVVLAGARTSHAGAKPNVKPGEWQTTVKMEMPGMPVPVPPVTTSSCLTKKDLVPNTSQPGQDCKVTKQKVKGQNVEWAVECKDQSGRTTTMDGKGTYKGDTFTGTMTMASAQAGGPGMQMTMQISSKRIGPCKKPAK